MTQPPRAPAPPRLGALKDRGLGPDDLIDDLLLGGVRLIDPFAEQAGADFAELAQVEMAGGSLAGSQWYRPRWVDVRFGGTDLANAVITDGAWERISATGVRATGLQLSAARLTDVEFSDSRLALLNVRGATLRRVRLLDCDLTDSQWGEAHLRDVELIRCRLSGAELSTVARIERVRLTDCDLAGVLGLGQLRGACVRGADPALIAQLLAAEMGLLLETE